MKGERGNDKISGNTGNDTVTGSSGNDRIYGCEGMGPRCSGLTALATGSNCDVRARQRMN